MILHWISTLILIYQEHLASFPDVVMEELNGINNAVYHCLSEGMSYEAELTF